MSLNWKTRLLILILVLSAALGAFVYNQIMIKLPFGPNQEDPKFFETNRYAYFYYNNGTMGQTNDLVLSVTSTVINQTHSNVTIKIGNKIQGSFFVNPNGIVYQNGKLKGNYSIWWVHISNPLLQLTSGFGIQPGAIFKVIDPTGFMGPAGSNYTAIVEKRLVWWPSSQKLWPILGAQASFQIAIYDSSKNKVVIAKLDLTCGLIETWDGGVGSRKTLTLFQTDYPISRNRLTAFPALWVIGSILIVATYIFMRVNWQNKYLKRVHLNSEKRNDTTLLLTAGLIAVGIEFVDIWFYVPLGLAGNLYLHLGFIGFLAIICYIQKKRFVWLIPAFLEVAFVFAINFGVGEPYVPSLTAFMGSTISWLCLLWVSKHDNDWSEGKTWVGKILSKFT
ncbi:MAG: hypothetical protein ACTSUG_14205 [Candidatus Helarchaeota archaeon]